MAAELITYISRSPEDTAAAAVRLGADLKVGDVLLLTGDVGAGKTHFARALIQSLLLQPEDVPSPTFTLVQMYDGRNGPIWHTDLYRLTDTSEVEEIGLLEAFDDAICLVEWPDRLGPLSPPGALSICFEDDSGSDTRKLTFRWTDPGWTPRVKNGWT